MRIRFVPSVTSALVAFLVAPSAGRLSAEDEIRYAFFLTADPQYLAEKVAEPSKLDRFSEEANQGFLKQLKSMPGSPIPQQLGGGRVSREILGIIVAGDLIDSADKNGGFYPAMQRFEWQRYLADYGLTGKEGKVPWPVYELHGNHDGPQGDTFVVKSIIERNKRRPNVVHRSANGLHYSWDWGPLHLVALGMFAGEGEERREDHHYAPRGSLEFLRKDLRERVGDSGRPVLLCFHLHPFGPEYDWPAEDLGAFWDTLKSYNVVALLHGHTHGSPPSKTMWDGSKFAPDLPGGIDVFNPDDSAAAKEDRRKPGTIQGAAHGFLYVELIDAPGTSRDRLVVRSIMTKDNWRTHRWDRNWERIISLGNQEASRP